MQEELSDQRHLTFVSLAVAAPSVALALGGFEDAVVVFAARLLIN
jgi:hypothetical protein